MTRRPPGSAQPALPVSSRPARASRNSTGGLPQLAAVPDRVVGLGALDIAAREGARLGALARLVLLHGGAPAEAHLVGQQVHVEAGGAGLAEHALRPLLLL